METFECPGCHETRPIEDKRSFHACDGIFLTSCRVCEERLAKMIQGHAESGAAWERDFGHHPVISYDTGRQVAKTAKEYRDRIR